MGVSLPAGYDPENGSYSMEGTEMQPIAPGTWRNCSDVWSEEADGILEGYFGVWLDTKALLSEFPMPDLPQAPASGLVVGEVFLISDMPNPSPAAPRPQGRPPKGDGVVQTALKNEFMARASRGELSEKTEAALHEAVVWAQEILGVQVSRTGAQRYLKPVLDYLRTNHGP